MLQGKKILLGITGSIAAYKTILLVRLLTKEGAEVKVVLTPSAKDFVSPLVLSTLSGNKVTMDLAVGDAWTNHVMLGRWADLMLIAPLSCNTLAKMASGICDNLLMATYLSATCPVMIAPAMDEDMWHHPATKRNLGIVQGYGNQLIAVGNGALASGLSGEGRMAEPEQILERIYEQFRENTPMKGKKVLITAGPTHEAIDPVRFIANHSSGKMGYALAEVFAALGAEVVLISGPTGLTTHHKGIHCMAVVSAEEMYQACLGEFPGTDIAILSAAVADYTPAEPAKEKIKKNSGELNLQLRKTKDILKSLGERKTGKQFLAGFALETNNEQKNALEKLHNKNADIIVLNSMNDKNATFGFDTNKVTIFDKAGNVFASPLESKVKIAEFIADIIIQKTL